MEIFTMFSIYEILFIIVTVALATKGVISFGQWAWRNLKAIFKKEEDKKDEITEIKEQLAEHAATLNKQQQIMSAESARLDTVKKNLEFLIESDREDIKAWITDKYHFFTNQGWIDDYSLDCIELRYARYIKEDGNSFIFDLMVKIRALPNEPPEKE